MPTDLRSLLSRPADAVAPELLGAVVRLGPVAVRLTEVEAYGGSGDPGSHAVRGRTPRNATMFEGPGTLYCYLSYGIHVCANVVTGPAGDASAVLLRAGEVVDGLDVARERRSGAADHLLARGPALLCRCLGIGLQHDGADLLGAGVASLAPGSPAGRVRRGPRVGLTGAPDRPWRWWVADDPTVSTYRRSPRATAEAPGFGAPPGRC